MEAPLFAVLALAAADCGERARPWRAGTCAALACVVRPEGVLLVGVLAVQHLRRPRELARLLVPVALIGAATVGWLVWTYGSPIPQSVSAKSQMHGPDTAWQLLQRWKSILAQSFAPHPAYLVFLPWVALGIRAAFARPAALHAQAGVLHGRTAALRTFSAFALAITLSYVAARPHIWGWYFYVPLVAWTAWLGIGIERSLPWLVARVRALERPASWVRPLPVCALLVAAVAVVSVRMPTPVPERVYEPMQRWARETTRLHPKARILASDIGAIGYSWNGTVLDSEGLVWPQALYYRFPNAMIQALAPEYLLIVAERPRLSHFQDRPDLQQQYRPIGRFSVRGRTELEPKLEELPPEWEQDYLVYERRDL
jgi:hypothetical protein